MRESGHDCASSRFTGRFVSFILSMLILAMAVPAMAQLPPELPHHVTPWTPMPQGGQTPTTAPQQMPPPGIALSPTSWTPIGPAPLSITATPNANFNVSGRIAALAAHPSVANTLYVAPAGGGVWKTTNGGTTWTPLTDIQTTLSMGAIAVAPSNGLVIYAGTGEADNSGDSNFGRGILVSTNGGTTWTMSTGASGVFNTYRMTTSKIAVDPTDATTAYAAMANLGINSIFCCNTGIWKTTNSGATWTNMTGAASKESVYQWSDVVVDPNTHTTIYGAVGAYFGHSTNGVYKSTDSGATWNLLTNAPNGVGVGRIVIALAPTNSNVLYVTASSPSTSGLLQIMRSDNATAATPTFTDLTSGTPNYMGGQGWYDTTVAVDPSNAAIVYVTGSADTNSMLRSTTSGASWTDISNTSSVNTSPHADHHGIGFDASGRLLDGDDGGIYRLDNPTTPSWTDLNGNLQTIQFQGIGLHPTDPNQVIGGSQDNGTEIYTGNAIWMETDGGDGGFAKFSPTLGSRAYHIAPVGSFGPSDFFRRSEDGGNTWASKVSGFVNTNTFRFYAPFVVDPGNGNRLLVGADRVYETTNGADLWSPISTPSSGGWTDVSTNIGAIGLAPSDANTVYAATGSSLFVTTNHGAAWANHPLPVGGAIADIQVDPTNPQIAYAVISAFTSGGNVFRTANGGILWTNISGTLPSEPVWSLQIDPSGILYVGAEDGVYSTSNGGTNWSRFGTGLPNAQVFQIHLNSSLHILGAGTHGRGMWEILIQQNQQQKKRRGQLVSE